MRHSMRERCKVIPPADAVCFSQNRGLRPTTASALVADLSQAVLHDFDGWVLASTRLAARQCW